VGTSWTLAVATGGADCAATTSGGGSCAHAPIASETTVAAAS
jgi:hypothetical protein